MQSLVDVGLQFFEEITMKDDADAHEQRSIDAHFVQDTVDGRAVAVQLLGQPAHGAFLTLEFFPDVLSNVHHNLYIT